MTTEGVIDITKRSLVLTLLVFSILIVLLWGDSVSTHHVKELTFESIDSIEAVGFVSKTNTENAQYYFSTINEADNKAFVNQVEYIIRNMQNNLDIPRKEKTIQIYLNKDGEIPFNNSLTRVFVSEDREQSLGAVVSYLSDYKLPAWLSVGLELYWQNDNEVSRSSDVLEGGIHNWINKAKSWGYPDFGDAWFIPNYLDEEVVGEAQQIAYMFVQYLDQEEQLQSVVDIFLKDKNVDLNLLRQYWSEFIETPNSDIDTSYRYIFSYEEIWFEVHSDKVKARYKKENWIHQQVVEYQNYLNQGVRDVENWMDYTLDHPLTFTIYPHINAYKPNYGGLTYKSGDDYAIDLYQVFEVPPYRAVHETVHAITFRMGIFSDFYPLTEGLAEALMYEFEAKNRQYVYNKSKEDLNFTYERRNENTLLYNVIQKYEKYTGQSYQPSNPIDLIAVMHVWANMASKKGWENPLDSLKYNSGYPGYNEDLDDYNKAASFVHYLIQTYGKEKFMVIYADITKVKETYNVDLESLIKEWKEFLYD
ncbi:hypothetical protein [Paenibacillus illinoisensis]|uniref:hypothetical protein n=1 Tax=Paenibacillus illinoisensis TaxID=59845 RepID=UPI000FD88375|nr:hypothetical protein [Paenibacillus illinoisensis]